MKRRSALQLFVSMLLLFVRTNYVNLTIFNRFKAFCRPVGKSAFTEAIRLVYNECKLFNEHKIHQKNKFKKECLGWCRYHLLTALLFCSPDAVSVSHFSYHLNSNNFQPVSNGFLSNETNFQMHFIENF